MTFPSGGKCVIKQTPLSIAQSYLLIWCIWKTIWQYFKSLKNAHSLLPDNSPFWHWWWRILKSEFWQYCTHQTIPSIKTSGPGFLTGTSRGGEPPWGQRTSSRVCLRDSGGRKRWGFLSAHLPPSLPQSISVCMCQGQAGLLWTMFGHSTHSFKCSLSVYMTGCFSSLRGTHRPWDVHRLCSQDLTSQPRRTGLLVRGHRGGWGMGILPPTLPWPQWAGRPSGYTVVKVFRREKVSKLKHFFMGSWKWIRFWLSHLC